MSIRRVASDLKARIAALRAAGSRDVARRFLRGDRGAIAIYFGLSAVVFVGVAGLAVDAARGYLVKARLSEAIDAAALAGGKALQTSGDKDDAKVKADALAFFKANFPDGAMGATVQDPVITVGNNATTVFVSSSAEIPTTLMSVLGFDTMTMVASGKVARAQGGLDVVFSFDVSGSMGSPATKLKALKDNANTLVDSLYKPFTDGGQQQIITVNGESYSLLNIGVVPWNSKVNVLNYPNTVPGAYSGPNGGSFTNPTKRKYVIEGNGLPAGTKTDQMPGTFKAANSDVPLLLNPDTTNKTNKSGTATSQAQVPGGWSGCVYARYTDDGNQANDADLSLGTTDWKGWEPIPNNEGENSDCYARYWNNNQNYDSSINGLKPSATNGWFTPSNTSGLRHSEGCSQCPKIGVLRLQTDGEKVKKMIKDLVAGGTTDAPQGLFWAYEVLMPGLPFDEAKVNPPFQRAQAIVFMTDGQIVGGNGDAYHGWFGDGEIAGDMTGTKYGKGKITLPYGGGDVDNNLNNRMLSLARQIKGANPLALSAVKIYVIQYEEDDLGLKNLLQQVATTNTAPYYFYAKDGAALDGIFTQIADSLSALRIVQ